MDRRVFVVWFCAVALLAACAAPTATTTSPPPPTNVPPSAVPPTAQPTTVTSPTAMPPTSMAPTAAPPMAVLATKPPPPTSAGPTAGELAEVGQAVYAKSCSCHGASGQGRSGPAVIGASARLAKYSTAQALLEYTARSMPANARGSLTAEEYFHVVAYLLLENKIVMADSTLEKDGLSSISLAQ